MSDENRKSQPSEMSPEFRAWADSIPKASMLCSDPAHRRLESELREARDALRAAKFSPLGDNHHNAAECPYCGDPLRAAQSARRVMREALDGMLGWQSLAPAHVIADARAALAAEPGEGPADGVEALRAAKDAAYSERNNVVALLARMALALGWRAGVGLHEDVPGEAWEPDWRTLLCIDLPTGQASWHFHDSERHLLDGLPSYPDGWDGHDTPEKYRRVRATLPPEGHPPRRRGEE